MWSGIDIPTWRNRMHHFVSPRRTLMRFRTTNVAIVVSLGLATPPASAWWDEGHMQIAAVAYYRLTPAVREKVDALIALNPQYQSWTAGWPAGKIPQYAFVRAATWADDI